MADSLGICHYKFSAGGWGFEVFVDVASVSGNNSLSSSTILTAFFLQEPFLVPLLCSLHPPMDAEDLEVHPAMIVSLEVGTVNFECSVEIRAYMIEHRSGSFFFVCA